MKMHQVKNQSKIKCFEKCRRIKIPMTTGILVGIGETLKNVFNQF